MSKVTYVCVCERDLCKKEIYVQRDLERRSVDGERRRCGVEHRQKQRMYFKCNVYMSKVTYIFERRPMKETYVKTMEREGGAK